MANFTENRFINWSNHLELNFDPSLFTNIYSRYIDDFASLEIEPSLTALCKEIRHQLPNVGFYLRGRFKSETSYICKTFLKLCDNIFLLFDSTTSDEKRDKAITGFFGFIKNRDTFNNIRSAIFSVATQKKDLSDASQFKSIMKEFNTLLNLLSNEERTNVIKRLGATEDIFAFRTVITSVNYDIKNISKSKDGQIQIIDSAWNSIPISPSIKINPSTDIYTNKFGKKCALIDGIETALNDKNLLYDTSLPAKDRIFENAKRDSKGNITFLRDSFIIGEKALAINSIYFSEEDNAYFFESNGERRNLSELLNNYSIQLQKNDSQTCIEYTEKVDKIELDFFQKNSYKIIAPKRKNYIRCPKAASNYQSIHTSFLNTKYGFYIESQTRTFEMEDDAKSEELNTGHDKYKKDKLKIKMARISSLKEIKSKDKTAFDSSASTIMKLLSSNPSSIELSEVLPSYILITPFADGVHAYKPDNNTIFYHFFENIPQAEKDKIKKDTNIDFTNYKTYFESINKINGVEDLFFE